MTTAKALPAMRETWIGRSVYRVYGRVPFSGLLLRLAVRSEGGQMYSLSLRRILRAHHGVEVGSYSYGSLLVPGSADRNTLIGRYVSIGGNAKRHGADHPLRSLTLHPLFYNPALGLVTAQRDVPRSDVEIGHDSWIGSNVVILSKVTRIGIGAVIGAGSVVTRDVPDFAVVAGNPARLIRYRFESEERALLLDAQPWLREPMDYHDELTRVQHEMSTRSSEGLALEEHEHDS